MSIMEETLATHIIREPSVRLVGRLTIDEAELSGVPGGRGGRVVEDRHRPRRPEAGRGRRPALLQELRQAPAGRQRQLPRPHPRGRPRLGDRARGLQLHHHRRLAVVHARAGPAPGRLGVFPAVAAVRGREGLLVRRARPDRRRPRAARDLAGGGHGRRTRPTPGWPRGWPGSSRTSRTRPSAARRPARPPGRSCPTRRRPRSS